MNFLAHLYCVPDHPDVMLGSVIADFVKGGVDGRFPDGIAAGILHHRRIDCFTDAHDIVADSRRLVSARRRRYAGIIVDVAFDHFLANQWGRYSPEGLASFCARVYRCLTAHRGPMPETARAVIGRMASEDWLASYRRLDILDVVFRRMSLRLRHRNPLGSAIEDVERNYELLQERFHWFFPQLLHYARACSPAPEAARPYRSLSSLTVL